MQAEAKMTRSACPQHTRAPCNAAVAVRTQERQVDSMMRW